MIELELHLPWGISANRYWRTQRLGGGRKCPECKQPDQSRIATMVSSEALRYRKRVLALMVEQGHSGLNLAGSLAVYISAHPPNRQRRDIDNLIKPMLDSLAHAGVIEDDFFVDVLTIKRCPVVRDGVMIVKITQLVEAVQQVALELTTPKRKSRQQVISAAEYRELRQRERFGD